MTMPHLSSEQVTEIWREFLSTGFSNYEARLRHIFGILPADHRCKLCLAPFGGISAPLVRLAFGKRPSSLNPYLCNMCDDFARTFQGGAEVELTMLFTDVRGSTTLAEQMSPSDFGRLINRFYKVSTDIMVHSDALIDKLVGDQVTGMYVPGFAGPDHARRAIEAGREVLRATGHADPDGPWLPVGAGVHTGVAFVGAVGSADGVFDITVLGDAANTAARLASQAGTGELLVSEAAATAAAWDTDGWERQELMLKGRSQPVAVWIERLTPPVSRQSP